MSSQLPECRQKDKAEGAIEALEVVKESLCSRELSGKGRKFVNNLINNYRDDVRTA